MPSCSNSRQICRASIVADSVHWQDVRKKVLFDYPEVVN